MPLTQKIFALARPSATVKWADMLPIMQLEAAHVWSLYERGIARDAWVRTDSVGAVYVLETTPAEAERLLACQPMAQHGLVNFEIVPVGSFTPLSLLFGTQARPVPPAAALESPAAPSRRVLALDRHHDGVTREDLGPYLADEARHAWSLWKAGVIRECYLRTDRPGAALVLEMAGVEQAHAVLADLPLVRADLIEFECLAVDAFMGHDALLEGALDA